MFKKDGGATRFPFSFIPTPYASSKQVAYIGKTELDTIVSQESSQ